MRAAQGGDEGCTKSNMETLSREGSPFSVCGHGSFSRSAQTSGTPCVSPWALLRFLLQNLQLTPKTQNSKHSLHQSGWNYCNLSTHIGMRALCVYVPLCTYVMTRKKKEVRLKMKIRFSLSKENLCHSWLIFFQVYFYAYTFIHLVFLWEWRWFWNSVL